MNSPKSLSLSDLPHLPVEQLPFSNARLLQLICQLRSKQRKIFALACRLLPAVSDFLNRGAGWVASVTPLCPGTITALNMSAKSRFDEGSQL
jgi:hypothetical protein